jgi:hypothetical protein
MELVLKSGIVEKIKTVPKLYGDVADALNITPMSLPRLLYENSPKLTQASVLRVIKNHLGELEDSELLEEKGVEIIDQQ